MIRRVTSSPSHATINERRLIEIFEHRLVEDPHAPTWLIKIELGTLVQDYQGIDVVVTTNNGPLFVQVKSLVIQAKQFDRRRSMKRYNGERQLRVGIVIVNDRLTDCEIYRAALTEFKNLREAMSLHGKFLPKGDGHGRSADQN